MRWVAESTATSWGVSPVGKGTLSISESLLPSMTFKTWSEGSST
jgi:hypothetical protein